MIDLLRRPVFWVLLSVFAALGYAVGVGGPDALKSRLFPVTSTTKAKVTQITDERACWCIEFVQLDWRFLIRPIRVGSLG